MTEEKVFIEPQQNNLSSNEDQQIQDGVNELVAILFEHWLGQSQRAREENSSDQPNAPDTS